MLTEGVDQSNTAPGGGPEIGATLKDLKDAGQWPSSAFSSSANPGPVQRPPEDACGPPNRTGKGPDVEYLLVQFSQPGMHGVWPLTRVCALFSMSLRKRGRGSPHALGMDTSSLCTVAPALQ